VQREEKQKEAQIKQTKLSNVRCVYGCMISKYPGCVEKYTTETTQMNAGVEIKKWGCAKQKWAELNTKSTPTFFRSEKP